MVKDGPKKQGENVWGAAAIAVALCLLFLGCIMAPGFYAADQEAHVDLELQDLVRISEAVDLYHEDAGAYPRAHATAVTTQMLTEKNSRFRLIADVPKGYTLTTWDDGKRKAGYDIEGPGTWNLPKTLATFVKRGKCASEPCHSLRLHYVSGEGVVARED